MKKILLVEDDRILSETLIRHLNQNGYHATFAYTKEDAVMKIRNLKFDLILLDVTLPDGNGFDQAFFPPCFAEKDSGCHKPDGKGCLRADLFRFLSTG